MAERPVVQICTPLRHTINYVNRKFDFYKGGVQMKFAPFFHLRPWRPPLALCPRYSPANIKNNYVLGSVPFGKF
jgi:hypothetical protein